MTRVTPRQRELLMIMENGRVYSPGQLAQMLDTSPEGAARTASSLVGRGLLDRIRRDGHVYYIRYARIVAS